MQKPRRRCHDKERADIMEFCDIIRVTAIEIPSAERCIGILSAQDAGACPEKGFPDLYLPYQNEKNGYRGLFIITSVKFGRTTPDMTEWLSYLSEKGYLALVCHGFDEAADIILDYIGRRRYERGRRKKELSEGE